MSIIKNLIIATVIGLIGYEVGHVLLGDGFRVPSGQTEIGHLLIYILVAFAATFTGGLSGASAGSDRETGTVKWFNVRKGYGFITRDQGDDVFVHFRNIEGSDRKAIREGERVSFIVINGDKGPQADKVKAA